MSDSLVRVLHIANSLGLGGTEKVMQLLVTNLDQSRFHPMVYSPVDGERGTQIRACGIDTHIGTDLLALIKRFQPHIVHIHRAGWTEPELLGFVKRAAPPVVVETNVFGRHDSSSTASVIDRTLFVSKFCLDRFHKTTGIAKDSTRYSFLYNPVDTDFFRHAAINDRDYSLPVAGRISRADACKWSRIALEILPILARDIPNFRFHVIGAIPETYSFVRDNGLERTVTFHDPVQTDGEIATFLNDVSLLAHANDTGESFGLVIAEAMACGLPVVTHPCDGLKDNAQLELVEHNVTGLIARSTDEYAAAITYLFTHPDQARRMGMAGREKAARLFRVQTVTKQLETTYLELLTNKGITL